MTSPWAQSYIFVTKNAGRFADDLAMGTGIQIGLINASKNYKRLKFAKSGNSQWEKKTRVGPVHIAKCVKPEGVLTILTKNQHFAW